MLCDLGRQAEAEPIYRRSIALCEQLVADSPFVPQYRSQLAVSLETWGCFLRKQAPSQRSISCTAAPSHCVRGLRPTRPPFVSIKNAWRWPCSTLEAFYAEHGHREEAESLFRRTIALFGEPSGRVSLGA